MSARTPGAHPGEGLRILARIIGREIAPSCVGCIPEESTQEPTEAITNEEVAK
jgi:hypothetical protein